MVEQASGKLRASDDGAIGEQNAETSAPEFLRLPSASFPGQAARLLAREAEATKVDLKAEGVALESGGEDWPDAYRHKPTRPSEQASFVADCGTAQGQILVTQIGLVF